MKHLVVLILIAAVGCGGSSDPSGGDDGEVGDLLGTFSIQLVAPRTESDGQATPGYTAVLGKVYDGVQPETVIWDPSMTSDGCVLSIPRVPFCSTSCGASAACVADNTCQAYPTAQSVGTVHVTGVETTSGADFGLTAVANTYQPAAGTVLSYPAFAEGDEIGVTASGSTFAGAFSLATEGVGTLTLAAASSFALASGQALALAWTAPRQAAGSRIHIKLDISHHGGSKGKIECDVEDTGALALDAAMVDRLLGLGAAGYPTIIVTRRATGHAAVATGHVDLVVSSEVEAPITVPGVQSCTTDTQCTAPATCQDDLTCR